MRRGIIGALLIVFALSQFISVGVSRADDFSLSKYVGYLESKPLTPWSTMALSSYGKANLSTAHLESVSDDSAIAYSSVILGLVAAGRDPRNVNGTDFVAKLKSFEKNGQLGDPALYNDDIFGYLALSAVSEKESSAARAALSTIKASQKASGAFSFAVSADSDTNMTSAAILALKAAGEPVTALDKALAYLKSAQNSDGGFPYDPVSKYGTDSDAASTAWVVWALNALSVNPASVTKDNKDPVTYLKALQQPTGFEAFNSASAEDSFSVNTTAYALLALNGAVLPVVRGFGSTTGTPGGGTTTSTTTTTTSSPSTTSGNGFKFRIEGKTNTLCQGYATGPSALDVVKQASATCGFSAKIVDTSYGPYVKELGSDTASGVSGWLYFVNNASPSKGANDYVLQTGDEVLWAFGDFDILPARLSVSLSTTSQKSVNISVENFDGSTWKGVKSSVYYGTSNLETDSLGTLSLNDLPEGVYEIYAEGSKIARTNREILKLGVVNGPSVTVSANVVGNGGTAGTSTGSSIGIVVGPSVVDFGSVTAGTSTERTLEVTNVGTRAVNVVSEISGDNLFVSGLTLDKQSWKGWKLPLTHNFKLNISLGLQVPAQISSGVRSGSIKFWAVSQ